MDEFIEVKIKNLNTSALIIKDVQNLLQWIRNGAEKPSYLGIAYKDKIKTVNLIKIKEYKPTNKIKNKGVNRILHDKKSIKIDEYITNYSILEGRILDCKDFKSLKTQVNLRSRLHVINKITTKNKKRPFSPNRPRKLENYYDLTLLTESSIKDYIVADWKIIYLEQDVFIESTASLYKDFTQFEELPNITENFLVSVDCEMVITETGQELGRVSILNHLGKTLYDKIVLPESKIIDYVTEYSGLTADSYVNAIPFDQMKAEINNIIGKNTVMVGHGLFNDLNALRIKHNKFIDTSLMYRTKHNYRISLKCLSKVYLQREIQGDTHCSIEDGMACLELLALKIGEFSIDDQIDFRDEIKFCVGLSDMQSQGINFVELSCDDIIPFSDSFNIYFYERNGKFYFIL